MKQTALYQAHIEIGAKTGEFAGYDMPLYYKDGVMAEHEWVRSHAGIFDVSHMGQVIITGERAQDFFETITPSSFGKAPHGRAKYTVMTNEDGGIVDDLIITKLADDKYFAVINAGCKDKDLQWMRSHLPEGVKLDYLDNRALIALQGPDAEAVLRDITGFDATDMPYMWMVEHRDYFISRVGYTGEDGFEISVKNDQAEKLWRDLAAQDSVKPIGLAARDSLRLEMGYCLYGHDIDDTTTPVEAGLSWVIGKDNTGFIGAEKVLTHKENGAPRLRTGIRLLDKGIAREGTELLDENDKVIGTMTSGSFSPTLKEAIGQAYVSSEMAKSGTKIFADVRGRKIKAQVCDMPFMTAKTKSMKKKQAA